jgi:hypothetical protein
MAVFVLTDSTFTLNTVDLSSYVTNIELTYEFDTVETTAMGATGHSNIKGLQNISCTVEMNNDLASAKVFDTVFAGVGSGTNTYVVKSLSSGTPNPILTVSNAFIASAPIVSGATGDLSKMSITLVGGTLVKT